jgi:hypothetical protein
MAMPLLTSILLEREIWEPGWRDRNGKDQQFINPGMNILTHLHHLFVVERYFKIDGQYGKDPRRLVNTIVKNKMKDGDKKRNREVQLDDEYALKIPDPDGSVEDIVLKNRELDNIEKEFLAMRYYRNEKERSLFRTVYIDHTTLAEAAESNGIASEVNLRQQFSRARKHAVAERDALFSFMLIDGRSFPEMGELNHAYLRPEVYELGRELVKRSVRPGAWLNGVPADGTNKIAIRPLTGSLKDAPGHIYLVAIRKDYLCKSYPFCKKNFCRESYCGGISLEQQNTLKYVGMLIDPASRKLQKNRYMYSILNAYPTELPHLNETLAAVRDGYSTWLISNSLPDTHRIHRWVGRETLLGRYLLWCPKDRIRCVAALEMVEGEFEALDEFLTIVSKLESGVSV